MQYLISAFAIAFIASVCASLSKPISRLIPLEPLRLEVFFLTIWLSSFVVIGYGAVNVHPSPFFWKSFSVKMCIFFLCVQLLGLPFIIAANAIWHFVPFEELHSIWPIAGFTGPGAITAWRFRSFLKDYTDEYKLTQVYEAN